MSETSPNSKGPATVQYTPETTEPELVPADQVKPEDIGTLSIEYRNGQPVLVVSGGSHIPARLPVVHKSALLPGGYESLSMVPMMVDHGAMGPITFYGVEG